MKIELVKLLAPLDRLVYWIRERESILVKKENGSPPPWTDDEILQSYRFTNVRRIDDRVSRWLLNNWYITPNYGHKNMLLACSLARYFNVPGALEEVGFPKKWEPDRIKRVLRARKARGETIFNGAYMVRGVEGIDKTEMVISMICQPLYDSPPLIDPSSMQKSVEALLPYWGFSNFMAGQVMADLRWATPGSWRDRKDWAPIGPGSARGMNRLMGRSPDTVLKQDQFLRELRELIRIGTKYLPSSILQRGGMEAMDWQNVCCESDKYTRTLFGEGKPKQKYPGGQ
jgi:alpha-glutamyl/putrescinyl thymine pyrophosphorylase clade 1